MNSPATPSCVFADGACDVQLVAVPGIGVGDHWKRYCGGDPAGVLDHLGHRRQTIVGIAERVSRAGAGHVHRVEAGALDGARRDSVVGAWYDEHLGACQQLAKLASCAHR